MPITEVLMGNHATSHAVRLARAQVISAYPITPQTEIVEELAKMCADERLKAKFIKVESEHSAMACLIGAAQTGVRTFTATSSQGLALMHELLFWAAYARLPIVLTNVNRAMAPGWNIWSDQTDSLAQRDTGWIQIYCETNQDILDTTVMAFKLAEQTMLPVMVVYDAFTLSHTYEPVEIPDQNDIDHFLAPREARFILDTKKPLTFGALTSPEHYMEFRYIMETAHQTVIDAYTSIAKEYSKKHNRFYDVLELYRADDAEIIIVTSGSMTSTAKVAIDELREKGELVGLMKLRIFRPFPNANLLNAIKKDCGAAKKLAVIDKNISHGLGGIWCQEIKASLCNQINMPLVHSYIAGLGGRDVTTDTIVEVYNAAKRQEMPGKHPIWVGLKK